MTSRHDSDSRDINSSIELASIPNNDNLAEPRASNSLQLHQPPKADPEHTKPKEALPPPAQPQNPPTSPRKYGLLNSLKRWWTTNIVLSLDHLPSPSPDSTNSDPRDYLALERTYLSYLRTSIAVVSFGVALLQLFFLKDVSRTTGIVVAAVCCGAGLLIAFVGCVRYFVLQKGLESGRARAGGWDVWVVAGMLGVIVGGVSVVVVVES